ncbi:hypothetical protein OF83DRAFT_1163714 [Amylostereum chailletii]|nr:hypothetical protein OF83DRAFT_1163714 [Amylostereum chailletii]
MGSSTVVNEVLSLPIGHHAKLRSDVSTFTSALLNCHPAISGFDPSIVVLPRRLHFTLGAITLLSTLRPRIMELLDGHKLRAGLERMDILKPERGDPKSAHVLYVGPDLASDDGLRLLAVGGRQAFRSPLLSLHCTMINTQYRRPRARGPRQPFSYASIVESAALRAIALSPASSTTALSSEGSQRRAKQIPPIPVKLGVWDVDEIQICEMGSSGPEGEYVRVGGCSLA